MKTKKAKVLLVLANSFMDNLIPLGISLLSACLKEAGHKVELFDTTFYRTCDRTGDDARVETLQVKPTNFSDLGIFPKETDLIVDFKKKVKQWKPDLIAVSVVESTYLIGLDLLDAVKESSVPTIMGGVHVTFSPDEVINEPSVDMICLGEGERAIVDLVNKIINGEDYSLLPNLWVKKKGKIIKNNPGPLTNLNKLPEQDWDIYEKTRFYKPMGGKIYIAGTFEMNRGCPYKCSFCCNKRLQEIYSQQGSYYRQKDIDILMDEVEKKQSKFGLQYLYLVAENFLLMNDKRFNRFIERYKNIRLPFWIETRPETVIEDRIKKLKEVGCEGLSIGVEHGNDDFRKKLLSRDIRNETMLKAFRIAKKMNIRVSANNIIGFPTETREQVFDTINLNRKLKPTGIIVNIFTPYRGTDLRDLSVKKGYLKKSAIAGDYRSEAVLQMPQLSPCEVKGLQRTFAMYVRFPKSLWPKIKKAEAFTPEGNRIFKELREKYISQYM